MDLRFRHHQDGEKCDARTVLTKYTASSLEKSVAFSNHRRIQFADEMHASVLSSKGSGMLLTFWQAPIPAGISNTMTSPVGMASL